MDTEKARSYLKTFLEVSEIQISIKESAIKRKNSWKRILDRSKISAVNAKIMELIEEKHKIQGRLDCVRLEMLDMILDEPSLVSDKLLAKKGYSSVTEFVRHEKENIELRGLYKKYPCSIETILGIAVDVGSCEKVTKNDVKAAVDAKNVKIMTKSLNFSL